jgi:hypothetical protein
MFQHTSLFHNNWHSLMFVPCIIRCSRNNQHYALIVPLLYSIYWLLHVSAVACHHQGASWIHLSYSKYKLNRWYIICVVTWRACQNHNTAAHRPGNHTVYDKPPIWFVFQVTQKYLRSSLMMAGYCQNMKEPVYRKKEWYKSVHSVGYFYYN